MATQTTSTNNSDIIQPYVGGRHPSRCIDAVTPVGYTAGNRFTIAHGNTDIMGNALAPDEVKVQVLVADVDGAVTLPVVAVVKWDATNVTLRSDQAAGYHFNLYVS